MLTTQTKQLIEEFGNDRLPPVRVLMEGKVGQAFLSGPKLNIVKVSFSVFLTIYTNNHCDVLSCDDPVN